MQWFKICLLPLLLSFVAVCVVSMEQVSDANKEIKSLKILVLALDERHRQEQDEHARCVHETLDMLFINNTSIVTLVVGYAEPSKERIHLINTDDAWKKYVRERTAQALLDAAKTDVQQHATGTIEKESKPSRVSKKQQTINIADFCTIS